MTALVDIHAHVLPGIDDGPNDLEGALEMARSAVSGGIGTMAATPHLRPDFPDVHIEELGDRCRQLRAELERAQIPLRVVPAAEVSLLWALDATEENLTLASYGQRGTDVLIETPFDGVLIEALLAPLLQRGLRITLAHPERSRIFQREPHRLQGLSDQGVLAQINGDALLAPGRSAVRRCAEHLLREGLVQVIESDGHRGVDWRPVGNLPAGVEAAGPLIGAARATWMASEAPAAIVEGRPLPPAPEIEAPAKSRWPFRR
jgi:protein-tyrosine phosphatase